MSQTIVISAFSSKKHYWGPPLMDSDVCDTPFDWAVTIKGGFCDECVWHVCTLATFQQEIAFPYPVYAKRAQIRAKNNHFFHQGRI